MTSAERKLGRRRLAEQLGVTADEIKKRIDDPRISQFTPVPVAVGHPAQVRTYIEEHGTTFPGVDGRCGSRSASTRTVRSPRNVLGYVGEINAEELKVLEKEGYRKGDLIGKDGVEQMFESELRGQAAQLEARGRQPRAGRRG